MNKIFGYEWEDIKNAQSKLGSLSKPVVASSGDYGADPLGDGKFRMVPSGDIEDFAESNKRLAN